MTAPRADESSAIWARRLLIAFVVRVVVVFTVIDLRLPTWVLVLTDLVVAAALVGLAIAMRPMYKAALGPAADVPLVAAIVGGGLAVAGGLAQLIDAASTAATLIVTAQHVAFGLWVAAAAFAWSLAGPNSRWRAGLAVFGGLVQVALGAGLIAELAPAGAALLALGISGVCSIPFFIALTRRPDPLVPVAA